jgi:hypothetical protein
VLRGRGGRGEKGGIRAWRDLNERHAQKANADSSPVEKTKNSIPPRAALLEAPQQGLHLSTPVIFFGVADE